MGGLPGASLRHLLAVYFQFTASCCPGNKAGHIIHWIRTQEPTMSFAIGENVGPYRIIEQLGQGGMATVYKAYHAALDRYVAIKVLHRAFMEDPNFLARFQREARVVARLEHPTIVPIYDFSEQSGQPYLVMKFIEGETLKARMLSGPLSKEEGLRIGDGVGQGLAYRHKRA